MAFSICGSAAGAGAGAGPGAGAGGVQESNPDGSAAPAAGGYAKGDFTFSAVIGADGRGGGTAGAGAAALGLGGSLLVRGVALLPFRAAKEVLHKPRALSRFLRAARPRQTCKLKLAAFPMGRLC